MSFPLVKLSSICEIQIGKTPSRSVPEYWNDGIHPWLSIADMNQGKFIEFTKEKITNKGVKDSNIKLIPQGTLLLSYKLSIGKIGFTKIPIYTNEAIAALTCLRSDVFIGYLYWALKSLNLAEEADRAAMGATLNKAKLQEIKIPLPPLEEQRCIAAILDKAEALRAKRREAIAKLDQLLQSVFLEMFGEPFSNPKSPVASLNSVCNLITDGTHQTPKWVEQGIPFIFQSNVKPGEISLDVKKFISNDEYLKLTARKPIIKNDILYTIVGSIGNAAMVRTDDKFCFQRHVAHIKTNEKIDSEFLEAQLNHDFIRKQAYLRATGIAQKTLILKELKEIKILLPSMEDQKKFILISRKIRDCMEISRLKINKMELLISSLQHQYF